MGAAQPGHRIGTLDLPQPSGDVYGLGNADGNGYWAGNGEWDGDGDGDGVGNMVQLVFSVGAEVGVGARDADSIPPLGSDLGLSGTTGGPLPGNETTKIRLNTVKDPKQPLVYTYPRSHCRSGSSYINCSPSSTPVAALTDFGCVAAYCATQRHCTWHSFAPREYTDPGLAASVWRFPVPA